jgi:hypothetical protein
MSRRAALATDRRKKMRRRPLLFALAVVAFAVTCISIAPLGHSQSIAGVGGGDDLPKNEFKRGLALAPVPLDLQNRDRRLVGLGSYIVNAQGACNDCHTFPSYTKGHDPFLGEPEQINAEHYLAGGRPFGPEIVSANITPDANGLPAGVEFNEFREYLRTGHDPKKPDEILQVMPWPIYGKMTNSDLRAVYEYLSAIPHAEPAP